MRHLQVLAIATVFSVAAFAQESKPLESKGTSKPPTVTYEPMQPKSGAQQQSGSQQQQQPSTSAQPSATQSTGGATGQAGSAAPGQSNTGTASQPAIGATAGANQSTTGAAAGASQTAPGTSGTMPQTGASAAPSSANNISGCLQRGFAHYRVSDNQGTIYELRGDAVNLSTHENHVVQIQGVRDTQPGANGHVVYYIQNVQDTGQVCGNNGQTAAGNMPVTGKTGNEGTEINSTNANGQTPTPGVETPGAMANPSPGTGQVQPNSPAGPTGQGNNQSAQPGANQNTQPGAPPNMSQAGQSAGAASDNAGAASRAEIGTSPNGTLGVNGTQPNNSQQTNGGTENKGVPTSGSPSGQQATTPNQTTPNNPR